MKKIFFYIALIQCFIVLPENSQAEQSLLSSLTKEATLEPKETPEDIILLDAINYVVCGPGGNTVFTDTDQHWKRGLDNQFIPLQKMIQDEIIKQQILSEKMPLDPEAIVKHVENIKKQINVNDAQLEQLFADVGCLMQEGIDYLKQQYLTEFFTYYKFKSQMVATDEEIKNYFEEYPEIVDGFVKFQVARVAYEDKAEQKKLKKELNRYIKNPDQDSSVVVWGPEISLVPEDLPEEQQFLLNMDIGSITMLEQDGVFMLLRLIAYEPTRVKTLDERKYSIIEFLNRERLQAMVTAYNQTVQDFIDVIEL